MKIKLSDYKNLTGYDQQFAAFFQDSLARAENLYGGRNVDYTIEGFEFKPGATRPHMYIEKGWCLKKITVILPEDSYGKDISYEFISHEIIHCLSPAPNDVPAKVIEEGLAEYFRIDNLKSKGMGYGYADGPDSEKYNMARSYVEKLLKINPDSIKEVRKTQPMIYLISNSDLVKVLSNNQQDLIDILVSDFDKLP